MRVLGFSEMWPKLNKLEFTTFRFSRRDKDWQVGEIVKVVYKPRSRSRQLLGEAQIIGKESRRIDRYRGSPSIPYGGFVTEEEAIKDGFASSKEMLSWLEKAHGKDGRWTSGEPMNKLTLRWVKPKRIMYMLNGEPKIADVGGSPWGKEGDIAIDEGGTVRLEVIEVLEWIETQSPLV